MISFFRSVYIGCMASVLLIGAAEARTVCAQDDFQAQDVVEFFSTTQRYDREWVMKQCLVNPIASVYALQRSLGAKARNECRGSFNHCYETEPVVEVQEYMEGGLGTPGRWRYRCLITAVVTGQMYCD